MKIKTIFSNIILFEIFLVALKFKLLQKQQQQLELSQNMAVGTTASGSTDINSSNTPHFEKIKKKIQNSDCDKNVKPKKLDIKNFVLKNKEKSQEVDKQTNDGNNSTNSNDSSLSQTTEGWISEDGDEDVDLSMGKNDQNPIDKANVTDSEDAHSTTTISTCSSPTPRSSPKHQSYRWRLNKKQITKTLKKVKGTASLSSEKVPKLGEDIVTEALLVYSTATVVWQDGTIESGIPSTSLYPIHHLDTHVRYKKCSNLNRLIYFFFFRNFFRVILLYRVKRILIFPFVTMVLYNL